MQHNMVSFSNFRAGDKIYFYDRQDPSRVIHIHTIPNKLGKVSAIEDEKSTLIYEDTLEKTLYWLDLSESKPRISQSFSLLGKRWKNY